MKTAARVLATWFYCGYAPVAPGTVGSAAAIVIAWLLHTYAAWTPVSFAFLGVLLAIPGIWASTVTADAADLRDPGIVADDAMAGVYGATVLFIAGWLRLY